MAGPEEKFKTRGSDDIAVAYLKSKRFERCGEACLSIAYRATHSCSARWRGIRGYAALDRPLQFFEVVNGQRDAVKCFIARLGNLDLNDLKVRMLLNPRCALFA